MFRKIMVPLDGSSASKLGLEEAIKLAKDQEASLHLFHVVDELPLIAGSPGHDGGSVLAGLLGDVIDAGRKILADAEAKARRHRVRAKSLLIESVGTPTSELIVEQAKKWRADLIVLGTHGRRGIRRLVMGSDAEGVVRTTHVPVLLVRVAARPRRQTKKRAPKL